VGVEPGAALATYLESDGAERIPGPYRAETIPVSVDADYVVVTMRGPRSSDRAASGPVERMN
jgi:3-phenylpropionate/trans-cinnamate dioxygenase ferredoxin subunit